MQSKRVLLGIPRLFTCAFSKYFSHLPHIPSDFNDYDLHRKLMEKERLPHYFNFCSDIIDQWAVSKTVSL